MARNYKTELDGINSLIKDTCRKIIRDNDEDQYYFLKGLMKMKDECLNNLKQEKAAA